MSPSRMSKIEAAIRAVIEFRDACNQHDVEAIVALLGDDAVLETADPAPEGTRVAGKEEQAAYWQRRFRNSPDLHLETEEVLGLGDRCIMRSVYQSVGPDRRPVTMRGADIFRVRDGSIREIYSYVKGSCEP